LPSSVREPYCPFNIIFGDHPKTLPRFAAKRNAIRIQGVAAAPQTARPTA
jgi:hypothetical protein